MMNELGFTFKFITETLGESLLNSPNTPGVNTFTNITTDSRKVAPGSLFVALKGDIYDGHDFIDQAIGQGASGILYSSGGDRTPAKVPPAGGISFFEVSETLTAFRRLAAAWRQQFQIPIIAVAGSVGKTTTKELLAAILVGKWPKVLKTSGSQNGFVGIPMTLLELKPEHQAAVIEVGIDEIGAMIQHLELVSPSGSILTAIGPEHLEKLKNIETVATEERLALTYVAERGGLFAINCDDQWIGGCKTDSQKLNSKHAVYFALKSSGTETFSDKNHPKPTCQSITGQQFTGQISQDQLSADQLLTGQLNNSGEILTCSGMGLNNAVFNLPLLGSHNARNLLGALAIARALGLTEAELKNGLATFKGTDGRSEVRALPGDTLVLCDYYNANPSSMEAGLKLLSQLAKNKASRCRWACLGDMLELGNDEFLYHRRLSDKIIELQLEQVLLFGPRMSYLNDELKQRQDFVGQVAHFDDQEKLAQVLLDGAKAGDSILIKGSRGMKMEKAWQFLVKHYDKNR